MSGGDTKHSDDPWRASPLRIDDNLRSGIALLWQAYVYAKDAQADTWDFALEIGELRAAGIAVSDLRWLVAKGFAEQCQETTVYGDKHRSFRKSQGLTFVNTSAFVLTPEGFDFAHRALALASHDEGIGTPTAQASSPPSHARSSDTFEDGPPQALFKPSWNAQLRELCVDRKIVKSFRVPAGNQEAILSAFEEEGWPEFIDDPLPMCGGIVPKHRLHNAINRLNQNQTHRLLRFRGNGNGDGIGWTCDLAPTKTIGKRAQPFLA